LRRLRPFIGTFLLYCRQAEDGILKFLRIAKPQSNDPGHKGGFMFIFHRPFIAVAAGLILSALLVLVDSLIDVNALL
jgi:hypothetical protein